VEKLDAGEAKGKVEQIVGEQGNQAGEGHDLPAVLFHLLVKLLPPWSAQFLFDPVPPRVASEEKGQRRSHGGTADGIDHSPDRSEENPGGDGEGQAGQKEAGGDGVEAHKDQGAKGSIPLDELPEFFLVKILFKIRRPHTDNGADKHEDDQQPFQHASLGWPFIQ